MVYFVTKLSKKWLNEVFPVDVTLILCEFMGGDYYGLITENIGVNRNCEDEWETYHSEMGWICLAEFTYLRQDFKFMVHKKTLKYRQSYRLNIEWTNTNKLTRVYCVIPANCPDYDIRDHNSNQSKKIGLFEIVGIDSRQGFLDYFVEKTREIFYSTIICKICGKYQYDDGFCKEYCKECMSSYSLIPCKYCGIHFGDISKVIGLHESCKMKQDCPIREYLKQMLLSHS